MKEGKSGGRGTHGETVAIIPEALMAVGTRRVVGVVVRLSRIWVHFNDRIKRTCCLISCVVRERSPQEHLRPLPEKTVGSKDTFNFRMRNTTECLPIRMIQ